MLELKAAYESEKSSIENANTKLKSKIQKLKSEAQDIKQFLEIGEMTQNIEEQLKEKV